MRGFWTKAAGLAGPAAAMAVLASTAPVAAHDHWMNRGDYRDPLFGEQCCDEHDCQPIPEEQVRAAPDGYHLASGEVIPYRRVLPSEDGQYWVCRWDVHWENRRSPIRCFFAPPQSN
ncbi:hypothetical protein WDZ92_52235 [Nostoc sp. NIES-2111]